MMCCYVSFLLLSGKSRESTDAMAVSSTGDKSMQVRHQRSLTIDTEPMIASRDTLEMGDR